MIFGSNGDDMHKFGKMDLFRDGKNQVHSGDAIYGDKGTSIWSGDTLFTPQGSAVRNGSSYYAPDGTYVRSGSILYGPGNKSYHGVNSDDDVWSIINHNNQ